MLAPLSNLRQSTVAPLSLERCCRPEPLSPVRLRFDTPRDVHRLCLKSDECQCGKKCVTDEIAMIVCSPVLLWEQYSGKKHSLKELVVIAQMILFLAKNGKGKIKYAITPF